MKKIVAWINSHKVITVCIVLFLLVVQPFFVHLFLKIPAPSPFFERDWNAGDLITYIAGFEAFIGTVFLGIVAVRQNDKANRINKSMVDNEEKHRVFERQPSVMLGEWEFVYINDPKTIDNYPNLFQYTDAYRVFLGVKDLSQAKLTILSLPLLNTSNNFIEVEFFSINLIDLTDKNRRLSVLPWMSSQNAGRLHIMPLKSIQISILLDFSVFEFVSDIKGRIVLRLINRIGEQYQEEIEFRVIYNTHSLPVITDRDFTIMPYSLKNHLHVNDI